MCTLVVASRLWKDQPLLLAANRDEMLSRPAAPPRLHERNGRQILAPVDLEAGGTWLGINDRRVVAAVTNRMVGLPTRNPRRRSRGELVLAALGHRDAPSSVDHMVSSVDPGAYNPFHLLVADAEAAFVLWSDGNTLERRPLDPGVHVVTERSLAGEIPPRETLLVEATSRWPGAPAPTLDEIRGLLSTHGPLVESVCVHAPELGYGTRSSSVIRIFGTGDSHWHEASGPPCQAPHEDQSPVLNRLG